MGLPTSEQPSSIAFFVNVPLFVFLVVLMALYATVDLFVLHRGFERWATPHSSF
jgi:hypothetical protein